MKLEIGKPSDTEKLNFWLEKDDEDDADSDINLMVSYPSGNQQILLYFKPKGGAEVCQVREEGKKYLPFDKDGFFNPNK